jgi:hypothetical protein
MTSPYKNVPAQSAPMSAAWNATNGVYPTGNMFNNMSYPQASAMPMWNPAPMNPYSTGPMFQGDANNNLQQQQMTDVPWSSFSMNPVSPTAYPNNQVLNEMLQQQSLQQQRLNYNHEQLLQLYQSIHEPHLTEFRPFGSSVLPSRNFTPYLNMVQGDHWHDSTIAGMSRARISATPTLHRHGNEQIDGSSLISIDD